MVLLLGCCDIDMGILLLWPILELPPGGMSFFKDDGWDGVSVTAAEMLLIALAVLKLSLVR